MKINPTHPKSSQFLWTYIRPYRSLLVRILSAIFVTAGTILSIGFVLRQFVDQGSSLSKGVLFWNPLLLLVLFSIIVSSSAYVRTSSSAWLAEKVTARLKQDLLHHVLYLPQHFFETARLGDLLSRFQTDITQIRNFLSSSVAMVIRSTLQLLGGTLLLILASPRLTLLVFSLTPFVIVPLLFLGRKVQKLTKESQDLDGKSGALIEENLTAISTVKAFTNERYCEKVFAHLNEVKINVVKGQTHYRSLLISLIIALVFLSVATILWVGFQQVRSGSLSMGQLSSFIFYAILVAGSLNNLVDKLEECSTALASTKRVMEIFSDPIEQNPRQIQLLFKQDNPPTIEFQQVSFHYPQRRDGLALSQISFIVEPCKKIALVGPSGAGKSSLFKLLLRLYEPQEGFIFLNGIPSADLSLEDVRSSFSLVPQDPIMFNASLFDNIRYGRLDATIADILKAAQSAYIDEFAKQLPQGYETLIGEKGIRLSGGQKQRIALARAILRNAPIFLLDEATNALDSYSEMIVQQALSQILQDKTVIVIAHRLATVKQADLILLLDQGQVVSRGSHQDLLYSSPLYQTLAETQLISSLPEVA